MRVVITFAWWFPLYMRGIVWCHMLTGLEPDWVKVDRMVRRAVRLKVMP